MNKCPHCLQEVSLAARRCPHCTSDLGDQLGFWRWAIWAAIIYVIVSAIF